MRDGTKRWNCRKDDNLEVVERSRYKMMRHGEVNGYPYEINVNGYVEIDGHLAGVRFFDSRSHYSYIPEKYKKELEVINDEYELDFRIMKG